MHKAVLSGEIAGYLREKHNGIIVDCTVGSGGHAQRIAAELDGHCTIIGIDQDAEAVERSRRILATCAEHVTIVHSNFVLLDEVLHSLGIAYADAFIFDLGISSDQIDCAERGFSFKQDGPLDMRMDRNVAHSALDIVNETPADELAQYIREYGEERFSGRIARAIAETRHRTRIETTRALADIIRRAYPRRHYWKIDPATRTFQALRIVVNRELGVLEEALPKALACSAPEALLCVIAFHSLEDRIVKRCFRQWHAEKHVTLVTKKPIVPSEQEQRDNPRARSAKLRIAKRSLKS